LFYASQLLAMFAQPLTVALLAQFCGLLLWRRRPAAARLCLGVAFLFVVALGWRPLPDALLRHLENQTQAPTGTLDDYTGIVVLGGALEPSQLGAGRDAGVPLNEAAERMTVPVALMRRYPHLYLLFTGGEASMFPRDAPESSLAKRFFADMGVPETRMTYESRSKTTFENAELSAKLPGIRKTDRWLLVTSAWHMPRAIATFRKVGWNVTPYPVDFRAGSGTPLADYSLVTSLQRWQLVLHEIVGTLVYRLAGQL
jgi:uncharacterized SAM-binding protein YcdF (DUF218 family)